MPSSVAVVTKAQLRQALAARNGGFNPFTTSGAGNSGGTTARIAALIGYGEGERAPLASADFGHQRARYRRALSIDNTTGDVTVPNAYTAQVATSVTAELHRYRPELFWRAYNNVIAEAYKKGIYREVNSYVIAHANDPRSGQGSFYGLPRNIQDVFKITVAGDQIVRDFFDRADSTSDPGPSWTTSAGTWGVATEKLYSSTDANADILLGQENLGMTDGIIRFTVNGTLNSGSVYRTTSLLFRMPESYAGVVDTTTGTALSVRLLNGTIALSGGTSLATGSLTTADGTNYVVDVAFQGTSVKVWVDGVQYIDYTLTGTDVAYCNNHHYGFREDKGGSPSTSLRIDDVWVFASRLAYEETDWTLTGDRSNIQIPAQGDRAPWGIMYVEGRAPLSPLATDTTDQTLLTDTTATIEIATTDQGWLRLLTLVEAELFDLYAKDVAEEGGLTPLSETYRGMAVASREKSALEPTMTRPVTSVRRIM